MPCETLAKLVHDLDTQHDSDLAASVGPRTLLVVDEAGMADTITLDRVIGFAVEHGATVRLIDDDQQLAAIGAGGVLRDIARAQGVVRLDEVVRFVEPVEAEASMALREGDRAALGYYLDHERIHAGDEQTVVDEVFDAWQREQDAGRDCLMLAPTRELVRQLNERARFARLRDTTVGDEVRLRDGTHASVGDAVLTRLNDRRLGVSSTDWVKNGDRWTVTSIQNGTLIVRHRDSGLTTALPAEYVAAHVELGYASTVHTAQGLTADVMHGIITGEETRQLLYTMLTRGRRSVPPQPHPHRQQPLRRRRPPVGTPSCCLRRPRRRAHPHTGARARPTQATGPRPRAFAHEGEYPTVAVRAPDRGAGVSDPQAARAQAATPRGPRCRPPPPGAFTPGAGHRDVSAASAVRGR
jgi:ATP-dependent exoDNAse (exonuclease V) alpha subunit